MPECSFCGGRLLPGTGILFVKKDGTPFFFCSRKCEKSLLLFKRKPTSLKWTAAFRAAKEALTGIAAAKAEKGQAAAAEKGKERKPSRQKKKRVRRKRKR